MAQFFNVVDKAKDSCKNSGGEVAYAQSYFAIKTRKQELLEERIRLVECL